MNPRLKGVAPSLIREMNARKKPGDVDLGLGEPQLPPPGDALAAAAREMAELGCKYGPNAGLLDLRAAISSRLGYPGLDRADNVCITSGSQEALYLAIKTLCDPERDEVVVCEPAYPSYRKIAQMEGLTCQAAAMPASTGFAFDAERVLAAVSPATRLIVLSSPANPTGRIAPRSELEILVAGLSRLPEPPYVLVDEAYRELWLGYAPPPVLSALYPRTLVAGSLSKSNALTGLRLGWLLAPTDVMATALLVHQSVVTSASALSQRVALGLFAAGRVGEHRLHYVGQWEAYREALARQGLRHQAPDGGFFAMVALPEPLARDSVRAAFALQEHGGVVTIPGIAFGECAQGWLRTSFVAPVDQLAEGAERMARYFEAACASARPQEVPGA